MSIQYHQKPSRGLHGACPVLSQSWSLGQLPFAAPFSLREAQCSVYPCRKRRPLGRLDQMPQAGPAPKHGRPPLKPVSLEFDHCTQGRRASSHHPFSISDTGTPSHMPGTDIHKSARRITSCTGIRSWASRKIWCSSAYFSVKYVFASIAKSKTVFIPKKRLSPCA